MKYYNPTTGQFAVIDNNKPRFGNTVHVFISSPNNSSDLYERDSVFMRYDDFIHNFYEMVK